MCNLNNSSLHKVVRTVDNNFSSSQMLAETFVRFVQTVCECSYSAILQNIHFFYVHVTVHRDKYL